MIRTVCRAIVTGLVGGGLACAAWASPVTFQYQGAIASVAALDPASPFPDPVDFGSPFIGTYTFDSAAANGIASADSGAYDSPLGTFTLNLGGLAFSFDGVTIVTTNVPGFKFYGAQHAENPTDLNPTGVQLQLNLVGLDDTALSSDALPLMPPALGNFDTSNAFFFTDTIDGNQVEVSGSLGSLVCIGGCAAVPEPSSSALVAIALVALVAGRRFARAAPSR